MSLKNFRGIKRSAEEAIQAASYDPGKLILIHTSASVLLALALSLIDLMLEQQIGGTGGLSGVGDRAILETAQSVLTVAQLVVALFWQIGYIYAALRISRRQEAGPGSLLEGFRKFGPVLRLRLSLGVIYVGLIMACIYGASMLFSATPWAEPLLEAYESGSEEALLLAMDACVLPMMGIAAVLALALVVPYSYRLRMAEYALMDDPKAGAFMAIRKSKWMMRRNCWKLLRLDLSFWWFYCLEMLITMIAYGDLLLPMFGVELPWSETVSFYIFLILCYIGQLLLYWWKGNSLQVAYALCYEMLRPKEEQ